MFKRSAWLLSVALAWGLCSAPILPDDAEGQVLRQPAPIVSPLQYEDESPDPFADDPAMEGDTPTIVTDDPTVVTDEPSAVTDEPTVVTDDPTIVTDEPAVVTDEPVVTADDTIEIMDDPVITIEAPEEFGDESDAAVEQPLLYDDAPDDDSPIDIGHEPYEIEFCDSPDCTDPNCGGCRHRRTPFRGMLSGSDWFVKTWIAQGFTGNMDSPVNRFNLPVTFNDRSNDYQMNQVYLTFGKLVDKCRSWDLGGRVDLLYGTDYFFTQAVGLELASDGFSPATSSNKWNGSGPRFGFGGAAIYGLAMPQAYAEVLTPLFGSTSVKLGHFYTIMGYESVMAPENFFYSHSYTMQYGQPRTHTGLLATSGLFPGWTFQYGFTRGWDTFEDPNSTFAFLGGVTFTSRDDRTSLSATVHTGNEDRLGENNRSLVSLVLLHQIDCRWTYVFQHDFGIEQNAEIDNNFMLSDAKWYSINQYLFCRLRDNLDFGVRVEWFRDQDNARVLGIPIEPLTSGGNYVATTFGFNWRPYEKVVLRPEIRWDWSDVDPPDIGRVTNGMFVDFTKNNQLLLGLDLIIDF